MTYRYPAPKARRVPKVSSGMKAEFASIVSRIEKVMGVGRDVLLGVDKNTGEVGARWCLYRDLYEHGWSIPQIALMTDHSYPRISYALKKMLGAKKLK